MYGQQHTPAPGSLKALMGGMGGMEAAPQPAGYGMGSYAYSQGMWKLRRRAADVVIDWTEFEAVAVGRKDRVRVQLLGDLERDLCSVGAALVLLTFGLRLKLLLWAGVQLMSGGC